MPHTYINKKDIVGLNQEIGENGRFHNEGSLDFALSIIKHKKSWLLELGYLVRSLLVDHVFEDGNKRTAMAIVGVYLTDKNIEFDIDKISAVLWKISKKNIIDINKIVRAIKGAIIY